MSLSKYFWAVSFILFCLPTTDAKTDTAKRNRYILILDSSPLLIEQPHDRKQSPRRKIYSIDPSKEKKLRDKQTSLIRSIKSIDSKAKLTRRFIHLINAVSIEIDSSLVHEIRSLPGVVSITPTRKVHPMLPVSRELMNLYEAWNYIGGESQAGKGVFIAVVDTGIDVTHPSFNDTGYEYPEGFPKGNPDHTNKKVIAARVFPPSSGDQGDTTPFDQDGHGTAVASIAGSEFVNSPLGPLSGIAPKAYLGNYKIFTSNEAETDQVIAAVEQAVLDGADVLNFSFGSGIFADPQHDPGGIAIQNAIDLGVSVVVAAGNDGRPFTVGFPSQIKDVLAVGSVSNSHASNGIPNDDQVLLSIIADGTTIADHIQAQIGRNGGPLIEPILGQFQIQDADQLDGNGYGTITDGVLCTPLNDSQGFQEWALIQLGDCQTEEQIRNARLSGAKGVLFYNSIDSFTTFSGNETTIPSLIIDRASGLMLKETLLNSNNVRIEIEGLTFTSRTANPDLLSGFSSQGPSVDYSLKPDVLAVGNNSFNATQNDVVNNPRFVASGYSWYHGTSMSTPRVAGLAAILRQFHPEWPATWIKSAITLSARHPIYISTTNDAPVLQRGAGRVDAEAALTVDTIVLPPLLGFGAHMRLSERDILRRLTIINIDENECDYSLEPVNRSLLPQIQISDEQFTLSPNGKINVDLSIHIQPELTGGDLDTDLILKNETTGKQYAIPVWARILKIDVPQGDILLVDDDNGETFEDYYEDRLGELGREYTVWDVSARRIFPTADYLMEYKTVIWFLSQKSLDLIQNEESIEYIEMFNPRHLFETALMKYLTQGGTLFLSGMDYFDDKEEAAFSQEVLRVELLERDHSVFSIQGTGDTPVGVDRQTFTLTFPENVDNFADDIGSLDDTITQPAFIADGDTQRTVGVTVDACTYRAVFLAFPLEVLSPNEGTEIMRNSLEWLQANDIPFPSPASIQSVSPESVNLTTENGPYSFAIRGSGFALPSGYQAYLDEIPIQQITRWNCNTLTGIVPAGISAGMYTLRVITADGSFLWLDHALHVEEKPNTGIQHWNHF